MQLALETRFKFCTSYHRQTDRQSEQIIQILEDMLRACILDFPGILKGYLPLVEFAYNDSYQAMTEMAPYEALYGRKCRSPVHWDEPRAKKYLCPNLVEQVFEAIWKI